MEIVRWIIFLLFLCCNRLLLILAKAVSSSSSISGSSAPAASSLSSSPRCIYNSIEKTLITHCPRLKRYVQLQISSSSNSKNKKSASSSSLKINCQSLSSSYTPPSLSKGIHGYEGLFGFLNISSHHYIVFIKASASADYIGEGVREITELDIQPLSHSRNAFSLPLNLHMNELKQTLAKHRFFYTAPIDSSSSSPSKKSSSNWLSNKAPKAYFDVTRSYQENICRQLDKGRRSKYSVPLWSDADERFFWNLNLISPLVNNSLAHAFIIPISNIWTLSKDFTIGDEQFQLTLISRRSRMRQGPRFVKRGIDEFGDVANFVETEHILRSSKGAVASFVQIRGSIPLHWKQTEWWRLKPNIIPLYNHVRHYISALQKHIHDLYACYILPAGNRHYTSLKEEEEDNGFETSRPKDVKDVYIVNLIDKHSMQGALGRWLSASLRALDRRNPYKLLPDGLPSYIQRDPRYSNRTIVLVDDVSCQLPSLPQTVHLRHIWFDYHKKADAQMNSVRELFPLLFASSSRGYSDPKKTFYFYHDEKKRIKSLQNNIIRTNCIDCLDRTNVIQVRTPKLPIFYEYRL